MGISKILGKNVNIRCDDIVSYERVLKLLRNNGYQWANEAQALLANSGLDYYHSDNDNGVAYINTYNNTILRGRSGGEIVVATDLFKNILDINNRVYEVNNLQGRKNTTEN